jgi:hypothetical protein
MERERLFVYKATAEERARSRGAYATSYSYLLAKYYQAREQYMDNLTKRQQNAINLIRIMDAGDWVEGIGGKVSLALAEGSNVCLSAYVAYILDC